MTSKKSQTTILTISRQAATSLRAAAERRGVSLYQFTEDLFEQLGLDNPDPRLVLRVPKELTTAGHRQDLENWLLAKNKAIVSAFHG